jgi:hypothetical protein
MFAKIVSFLNGKKTFGIGILTIVYGIYQVSQKQDGFTNISLGFGMLTGRSAIAKLAATSTTE